MNSAKKLVGRFHSKAAEFSPMNRGLKVCSKGAIAHWGTKDAEKISIAAESRSGPVGLVGGAFGSGLGPKPGEEGDGGGKDGGDDDIWGDGEEAVRDLYLNCDV